MKIIKKILWLFLLFMTVPIFALITATSCCWWVQDLDGQNYYDIICNIGSLLKFFMALVTFFVFFISYAWFVLFPLVFKVTNDE